MRERKARLFARSTATASAMLVLAATPALPVCGDLNDTATLTSTDALLCLQGAVGVIELDGLCEPGAACSVGDRAGDALDPDSEVRLVTIAQPDAYHNGGGIQFGPDGYLWIGMGDGNGIPGGDLEGNAQDDATPLGKMLRVDVNVDSPPFWAAPPDNPNPNAAGLRRLIWSKGFRNPWRFSFDRETGDLYIGDVGQGEIEEIDFQPAASTGGENYGWNVYEGSSCFSPPCSSASQFVAPVHEYAHEPGDGGSVTGGYVYRGCSLPDLHGTYFYADWVTGRISSFEIASGNAVSHADRTAELQPADGSGTGSVSSFGEDARGEIYLTDYIDGDVLKIVPD